MKKKTEIIDYSAGKIVFFKWKNETNWPVEYVSPSIKKVFGYEAEDFLSGKIIFSDLIHPNDLAKVTQEIYYASTHNKTELTHEVYRLQDASGKYRHIYDHTLIIRNDAGEITHFQGYISDESAILEQNERLELVLGGMDLGLWDWNLQSNNIVYDERWANMLGYKLTEITPSRETWESKVHPDDIAQCFNDITAHIEGKTNFYSNVHRMMHKDGKWRYLLDRGRIAKRDDNGKPIRFTGTHTDITYIKETEIKLQKKQKKIDQYVKLVNQNIITSSTNLQGIITYVSDAFSKISGYSAEELLGKNHRIVKHPDMDPSVHAQIWETITQGLTWKGEVMNMKKGGGVYWVDATISPLLDDDGKQIGFTAIRQDITDKKLLEEISITDGLTHIFNRRHFNKVFPKTINAAKRHNELLTFLVLDIDHFKQYNDTYGHQEGDEVLIQIAQCLKEMIKRATDYCFRLGGEEFGLVYKSASKEKSHELANTLKNNIEKLQIKHSGNSASKYVTASFGLVCHHAKDISDMDSMYKEADDLLYEAKKSGRNRVCFSNFP